MENKFAIHFFNSLLRNAYSVQTHNYDWLRYESSFKARLREQVKDLIAFCCQKLRVVPGHYDTAWLAFILDNLDSFDATFCMLGDSYSREVMLKVLAYRVLGPRHVKLPQNTENFWAQYNTIDQKHARQRRTQPAWNKRWFLNAYEVTVADQRLIINAHPLNILDTFLLEQYAYNKCGKRISARQGDVIMDGGGCYGDTALYFAAKAGNNGAVVTFEFMEENLRILKKNLAANPELENRIRVVNKAIWKHSGEKLSFKSDGPGTRISSNGGGGKVNEVETASIDEVVKTKALPKVDFIKMDIEGAELEGLKGSRQTIERFKPTLAISLYHKKEDFITIPQWIQSLGLGYEFYLDHFTIHGEETILFATSRR